MHPDDGADVNPFPYLNAAERLLFPGRIGESFSLGVRGVPIAAGAGTITLRATAVRWWPGGRWTSLVRERPVELAMAKGAVVDTTLVAALASPERRVRSQSADRHDLHRVHGAGEGHGGGAARTARRARRGARHAPRRR